MALLRADDFLRLAEKLRQGYLSRLVDAVLPFGDRTRRAWRHTEAPPRHWGSIPRIREHWNECISGDRGVALQRHVARSYPELRGGTALSIACGAGSNEVLWAQTDLFDTIRAFDLSPSRIEAAKSRVRPVDSRTRLEFVVAAFRQIPAMGSGFDAVLAENALHHARDLEPTVDALHACLRPGGLLILRDFVGPSRFQWTDEQLRLTRELLERIPEPLRRRWKSQSVKRRHFVPGTLGMMLTDPSEAAHSSRILPVLKERFDLLELRPLGGTLLQLVFDDIAHHFVDGTGEADGIVEQCIAEERRLIESGRIPSDFVFGVFRRRDGNGPEHAVDRGTDRPV